MAAFQLPWLPELALSRRGGQAMRDALVRTGLDPDSAARYAARAADPAAMRGPLNWYRAIPAGLRERTGRIEVPTLFVWSDGDPFVSWAAAGRCGHFVSGPYRLQVLNGTSHWLPEQVPDRVAALLTEHFAMSRLRRGRTGSGPPG
jgi:pimeloyl-ACP methyl ester carboxylesterase